MHGLFFDFERKRKMFNESKSSQNLGCSCSSSSDFEAACLHRQRLLDIGLPAVIDKDATGKDTVYIVLPTNAPGSGY
jgi:hypothetical protein